MTIKGNAFILESIIGGGEFGRVLGNTLVKIEGGQIGVGENKVTDGKPVAYTEAQWTEAEEAVKAGSASRINAIAEQMRTLNEKRRNSQPLDLPSCGSAFKRPVGGYAAALIEEAGLKGYSVGGAQVSEKHSGFVVNKGGATYDDIVALMDHIRKEVKKNSGITLEPEMKIYPKKMILVDQTPVEIPEELKEEFEKFKQERAKQKKDEES